MINFIKNFRKNESGAVTVDWVVLTAAVVALGGAAYSAISSGVTDMGENVSTAMDEGTINVDTGQ
ncbi:hypothetical protein PSM7751_01604 [Pseudooceanicola marinus]|uniref:Flp/Fap pilin component n=1 Tax=Pseudooceanicola marinus TaxID=396013 RepID=A0A1X6Z031_9RHOB|nr:hypothetical protein [Pseudooceanicola marinus]PJE32496.1 hypothetical protein CVM50_06220 [Pseudooceanicola marinus]SLN36879.1 hypothetical protein PSM7751_01604 [Pseudooceanicola marinus]